MLITMSTYRFGLFALFWFSCICLGAGNSHTRCIETEKQALILLKEGFIDESGILSSWNDEVDCCEWKGISCNNLTSHVTMLHLESTDYSVQLRGKIHPSLCELQHLTFLDLSHNHFQGQRIPKCIGSLSQLIDLKLADAGLIGSIPQELRNLSNLQTLDLDLNHGLVAKDLEWVSHLSCLRYLYLSAVDLSQSINWLSSITKVPSLLEIVLNGCRLSHFSTKSFSQMNSSTTLKVLDLSGNDLNSSIPSWVFNVSKVLIHFNLSDNHFQGLIPDDFANMASLEYLDLSQNKLQGSLPNSFHQMCHLKEVYLYSNNMSGKLSDSTQCLCSTNIKIVDLSQNPFSIGQFPEMTRFSSLERLILRNTSLSGLFPQSFGPFPRLLELDLSFNKLIGSLPEFTGFPSLEQLDISHNQFNGSLPYSIKQLHNLTKLYLFRNEINDVISEAHLSNLSRLKPLDVCYTLVSFNFSSNWVPPFQLAGLFTAGCNIGPHFPLWIKNQRALEFFDISDCGISDSIPEWFWDLSSSLIYLNFSYNKIHGALPKSFPEIKGWNSYDHVWDLTSNTLSGALPIIPKNFSILLLSNNMFSGSLSSLCKTPKSKLYYLDLSNNLLSGRLGDCWEQFHNLRVLNLANNNFSGKIPKSIGLLENIETIHLSNNNLSGEMPSLMNCPFLHSINLGENNLHGILPEWIGHNLPNLIVLRLRANKFQGSIPVSLCSLTNLQVLDLSQNNLTGEIPFCLNNITVLRDVAFPKNIISYETYNIFWEVESVEPLYVDNAILMWKGEDYDYGKNLGLMTTIDLSSNHLCGEIPGSVASLLGLASLNLSGNNLTGFIPSNIGQMKLLESLDLSRNCLFGSIPESFTNLSFISYLDLSFNNLSGAIPSSTQLQSFDASRYMANPRLCGPPLEKKCPGDDESNSTHAKGAQTNDIGEHHEDGLISFGFHVSMILGFIIGFWGVFGSLIVKRSWRHAYFQFLNNINDWMHVQAAFFAARMKRRLQN